MRRMLISLFLWTTVASVAIYAAVLRPLQRKWGIDPHESQAALPGDDVVTSPSITDTRGITIAATPARIWPWLLQLGFGRAGWYSYDQLDNRTASVRTILPEHQHLAVGDIVPTHPDGGFRVAEIEPERSLVLYLDTAMVAEQAAVAAGSSEELQAGLKVSGVVGAVTMPTFEASWTFVLEPVDDGHTRLIERFRVKAPEPSQVQRLGLPFMGLGVFLMSRKQMLGIKERAERLDEARPEPEAVAA